MSDLLERLAGQWQGTATTWFEPGPGFEDPWKVSFRSVAGGNFVLQEYTMNVQGNPHEGCALIGRDQSGNVTIAWADSFHTGESGVMTSTGRVEDGVLDVLGSFEAGGERWGWRTQMQFEGEVLVMRAFNISPAGESHRAIEMRLRQADT
jgi:hypothetical protein